MLEPTLDSQVVRMPEFAPGEWLNTDNPPTRQSLRGQVVLVDFWDYTCINCIRTLPYLTAWHDRYAEFGLVVIGVHAPEFSFARTRKQIEAALEEFGIRYPVLLDNNYETWMRFANRAWPTKYLIDSQGYIRYKTQGEGRTLETELAIQAALKLQTPTLDLPDPMPLLRPEDASGAVCYRPTPELYTGMERGVLGNAGGYGPIGKPVVYLMPEAEKRVEGAFYCSGIWRAEKECMVFAGQDGGSIRLPYRAVTVNMVLSPSADPVELLLDLPPESDRKQVSREASPKVEVRQDGLYLTPLNAGADIEYDDGGLSYVSAERPRMVQIVSNPDFEEHEIELTFKANGLALYAFTFTTCISER
jgi:thiol-disulfide isomerase/thioredoxin